LPVKQYAQALLEWSDEQNKADIVYKDLLYIEVLIKSVKNLRKFFENLRIPIEVREKVIKEVFHSKLNKATYRFLLFLNKKGRLDLIFKICQKYEQLYFKTKDIVKAKIITSHKIDQQQIQSICKHFKKRFDKQIDPQTEVDSSLIGGFKIHIKDNVYDYSFKTHLETFRKKLIHA